MNTARRISMILPLMAVLLLSVPAQAEAPAPQNLVCKQIENFGQVTVGSVEHAHPLIMKYAGQTEEGGYIYSGFAEDHNDSGGGQSMNAIYDPATGAFVSGDDGLVCPDNLTTP